MSEIKPALINDTHFYRLEYRSRSGSRVIAYKCISGLALSQLLSLWEGCEIWADGEHPDHDAPVAVIRNGEIVAP